MLGRVVGDAVAHRTRAGGARQRRRPNSVPKTSRMTFWPAREVRTRPAVRTPEAARLFMGETKPVEELYDIQNDKYELRNLTDSPQHKAVLERMLP